ncbi:MAG: aminotransferase class I/II-fold pyridoxal phosphate-dependent enzyme [Deltaproteobacteria bacterium]|nr:aminotransferase class I/II-fold pyridoxal phosphate-dependent enzyme [Deltaproteobacteria bacterium]
MYRIGIAELVELAKVVASGQLARAPAVGRRTRVHLHQVDRLERELAALIGTRYALALSGGGSAALTAALVGFGIGPGDEVIVPAYTWIATPGAVLMAGAIPVLAEIDASLTLDPDDLERQIGPATRAVIPVHMRGRPADMERILAIAQRHGLRVLEDVCQAAGASYRGRRLGGLGAAGAFSFNQWKLIAAGEGGALVTDDREVYERALLYHDNAAAFRPPLLEQLSIEPFLGHQLRAGELMGAVARVQLRRLEATLARLRWIRRTAETALVAAGGRLAPSHDADGDAGVAVALQFADAAGARRFVAAVGGEVAIDGERHVYANWTAILSHRVLVHPAMNPFEHERNRGLRTRYAPDMCPRTLDILSRTVLIELRAWNRIAARLRIARWARRARG